MNIIRDEATFGIMMIPLWTDWHIRRCNVEGCESVPTTIITGAQENCPAFGLCEIHYLDFKETGEIECTLIFDEFDAFKTRTRDEAVKA